jgi:hypothetical protein
MLALSDELRPYPELFWLAQVFSTESGRRSASSPLHYSALEPNRWCGNTRGAPRRDVTDRVNRQGFKGGVALSLHQHCTGRDQLSAESNKHPI